MITGRKVILDSSLFSSKLKLFQENTNGKYFHDLWFDWQSFRLFHLYLVYVGSDISCDWKNLIHAVV